MQAMTNTPNCPEWAEPVDQALESAQYDADLRFTDEDEFLSRGGVPLDFFADDPCPCDICGDTEAYLIAHPSKPIEVCEMCFDALGDRAFANGYTGEVSL